MMAYKPNSKKKNDLKLYLLELNQNPSFSCSQSNVDYRIKQVPQRGDVHIPIKSHFIPFLYLRKAGEGGGGGFVCKAFVILGRHTPRSVSLAVPKECTLYPSLGM